MRPSRKMTSEVSNAAPATTTANHLLKVTRKYWACQTRPLLTRHETCWKVTKCHACHEKNNITACFETFNKDGFCSFPHRHCDGTKEASDSRRDMLERQSAHFLRGFRFKINVFLRVFLNGLTAKSTFRVRGFRRFS